MKKIYISIVLLISLTSQLMAMTQNQLYIMHQVLNVDQGKVTKQMHTDFWKDVPNKEEIVDFYETTGLMAKITRDGMRYQMELWKSALISYQNQQVFKSEDYINARETMNDFINRVSKNIPNETERSQVINQMKTSMINSDNLLKSAASRTDMQSVQGPIVELSEERIIKVINNIEKSFSRIDKLLKPEWIEAKIEKEPIWMICEPNREYWGIDRKPLYVKFHNTKKVDFNFDKMEWVEHKNVKEVTPTIEIHEDKKRFTDAVYGYNKIFPIYVSDNYYVFYKQIDDGWWWGGGIETSAQHIILNRSNLDLLEYNNQWVKGFGMNKKYNDSVIDELFREINEYPKELSFNVPEENTTEFYPNLSGGTFKGKRKLFTFECKEIPGIENKI